MDGAYAKRTLQIIACWAVNKWMLCYIILSPESFWWNYTEGPDE